MYYPEFPKKHDVIGISAPSQGVGHKIESYEASLDTLTRKGFEILETAHVRVDGDRGGSARERGAELTSLFADERVRAVISAAGGDFLFEILPYVNWSVLRNHPKWLCGASDPTSLLYTYTVKYDVATLYGFNAGSFDEVPLSLYDRNALNILTGKLPVQKTSKMYASKPGFAEDYEGPDTPTEWKSPYESLNVRGRCIGGCIDVLKDLIGTEYDQTRRFVKKYRDDGIIWYFDTFSLSAEVFYRTLLQMKYAGWFENARAVLVGRVLYPSSETGMSYEDAMALALENIPRIYEMDIGHTVPGFTMINGAMLDVSYRRGKGSLTFELK